MLDRKNPIVVYGATGETDDDGSWGEGGWFNTDDGRAYLQALGGDSEAFRSEYTERIDNPNRYEEGRRVRFALSWEY